MVPAGSEDHDAHVDDRTGDTMAFKDAKQCKARSKRTGKRCKNPAVKGFDVCRMHGAHTAGSNLPGRKAGGEKPPGSGRDLPKGHTMSMKHGAYSARLLPDEQADYEAIKADLEKELDGPNGLSVTDRLLILRVAANAAKITSATEKEAPAAVLIPLHRLELELLRELKATRASKGTVPTSGTTPAEVMGNLLAKLRERGLLPASGPAEAEVIDVEVVEVEADESSKDD